MHVRYTPGNSTNYGVQISMMETQICSIRFWIQSVFHTKANCTIRWIVSPWSHQIHHMVNWSFWQQIQRTAPEKQSYWYRYVHDTFVVWFHFQTHLSSIQSIIRFSMETEEASTFQYSGKEEAHWLAEAIYQKCTHTALSYMPGPIAFHRSILFLDTPPTCHDHVSQKAYEEILHLMRTLGTFSYTRATVQWTSTVPSTLVGLSKIAQQVWQL